MATEIKLPKFGKDSSDATIIETLVKQGDYVEKGTALFDIETDKVTLQLNSENCGYVKKILVENNQQVLVGQPLLIIGEKNETVQDIPQNRQHSREDSRKIQHLPDDDIAEITPQSMLKSKSRVPCFYLSITADITNTAELLEKNRGRFELDDIVIKVLSEGFAKWPIMTGRFASDSIKIPSSPAVGIMLEADDNKPFAPVIKDISSLSLCRIYEYRQSLYKKIIAGKITSDDCKGGCMTICNLGTLGVDSVLPIVIPGQCSILGLGRITESCVSGRDGLTIAKQVKLTLSVDHRIANGAEAAQFFSYCVKLLEDAERNFEF